MNFGMHYCIDLAPASTVQYSVEKNNNKDCRIRILESFFKEGRRTRLDSVWDVPILQNLALDLIDPDTGKLELRHFHRPGTIWLVNRGQNVAKSINLSTQYSNIFR